MDRLTSGFRIAARAGALLAADRLEVGKSELAAVVGRFQGADAVIVTNDRRMLTTND